MNSIKTTVFNLIILDESGSMHPLTKSTISGCNEVLNVIRNAQADGGDNIRNLVSIYTFQSGGRVPSRYLIKNKPIAQAKDITTHDYRPDGCTPLLDAVGATLSDLFAIAETHEDANAIITIITDGMENSSTHYSAAKVAMLINRAKELGWTVNLIGANIDVASLSSSLNIDNKMNWEASEDGTDKMYSSFSESVNRAYMQMDEEKDMDMETRKKMRIMRSRKFFD